MRLLTALVATGLLSAMGCDPQGTADMNPPAADISTSSCNLGTLPSSYESAAYEANSAVERDLRARFKAFLQPMREAEMDLSKRPTKEELEALFAAGNPSLRSITSAPMVTRVEGWLTAFAVAAGNSWTPTPTPMGPGGKFGSFIFTAQGTDLRQAIEKGLFSAAFYNHALGLMNGPVTAATLDRLIAIFGAHASFPASTMAPQNPDEFSAAYAKRRDKLDAQNPGPYLKVKGAFIRAKAAIEKGDSCRTERDAALATFRAEWERALFATAIFYLNDATKKLSAANPPVADQASALHGYGEAVGFIHGWRQLPTGGRIITDAQVDELLQLLGAPVAGPVTSYRLITDTATELPKLTQTINRIAAIYGFTPQQIEDFKTNYP